MREGLQEVREEPGRCSRIPERCRRSFTGVAGEQEVKEEPREVREEAQEVREEPHRCAGCGAQPCSQ